MPIKVGIQLYSVRNAMKDNPMETIENVAKVGFKYIELANHNAHNDYGCGFGMSADMLKANLDKFNLKAISAHVFPIDESNIEEVIKYHSQIGNKNLVNPIEFFHDKSSVIKKCELYNRLGKICRESGISFLYHNHFHEFQKFNGEYILDIIAKNTDPEYVNFEIDVYWVMRGGVSPVDYIKKLGKRNKLLHLKDMPKDPSIIVNIFEKVSPNSEIKMESFLEAISPEDFIEIGEGVMNINEIIGTAEGLGGTEYIILEQDYSKLPEIDSIKLSMKNLKKYKNIII